jgi:desulfoferrodoxin-like iron-binding protein
LKITEIYNIITRLMNINADSTENSGRKHMVNVQKAGEVYRCNVCGNIILVQEAGGGEILCHGEPMQLIEVQESQSG